MTDEEEKTCGQILQEVCDEILKEDNIVITPDVLRKAFKRVEIKTFEQW